MMADDFDDEDDFADRDREDPREDIGYRPAPPRTEPEQHPALAPRLRRPPPGAGHWAIAWVEGEARDIGPISSRECAPPPTGCGKPAPTLHADPDSGEPRRVLCGACEGKANRARIGGAR